MDSRLFLSTFVTIFLAEMGDKTQLTAMSLAAGGASRSTILLACSLALISSTALAVVGGEALTQVVPLVWVRRLAGLGFVLMGASLLWQARGT